MDHDKLCGMRGECDYLHGWKIMHKDIPLPDSYTDMHDTDYCEWCCKECVCPLIRKVEKRTKRRLKKKKKKK